jgi:hypothetical protein
MQAQKAAKLLSNKFINLLVHFLSLRVILTWIFLRFPDLVLNILSLKCLLKPDHKNKEPRHVAENPWN